MGRSQRKFLIPSASYYRAFCVLAAVPVGRVLECTPGNTCSAACRLSTTPEGASVFVLRDVHVCTKKSSAKRAMNMHAC